MVAHQHDTSQEVFVINSKAASEESESCSTGIGNEMLSTGRPVSVSTFIWRLLQEAYNSSKAYEDQKEIHWVFAMKAKSCKIKSTSNSRSHLLTKFSKTRIIQNFLICTNGKSSLFILGQRAWSMVEGADSLLLLREETVLIS